MKRIVLFCLVVVALAGFLRLVNWFPLVLSRDSVQRYTSVERAERVLKIKRVHIPRYFPSSIVWPPKEIIGAGIRGKTLLMHFAHRQSGDIILALSQREVSSPPLPSRIDPVRTSARSTVSLKGVTGALEVAFCEDRTPCNRISWRQGSEDFSLTFRGPVRELTRIAESMVPE